MDNIFAGEIAESFDILGQFRANGRRVLEKALVVVVVASHVQLGAVVPVAFVIGKPLRSSACFSHLVIVCRWDFGARRLQRVCVFCPHYATAGMDQEIWQCPVVLLADVRSVGVQGDGRTYGHPIVLRPVSSEDAMTADWTRLPYDVLARISTRITNSVPEVNRVVLDVTSKPPATIEWE